MPQLLDIVYFIALVCASPWIVWRSVLFGRYRRGWGQRLFGLKTSIPDGETVVWLHAVSVGEVQILRTLVEQFEKHRPDVRLAISITTDSGMDLGRKLFAKHLVFFTPIDFSWAIRNTFRVIHPNLIILAELEVWPNWVSQAQKCSCPVAIVNGRLSQNSLQGYLRLGSFARKTFAKLTWVGAQSESYAERFRTMGVEHSKVSVTGNTKFDGASGDKNRNEVQTLRHALKLLPDDIVWVAGSTQEPEEELVLRVFCALAQTHPRLKLILVPRHPERFEDVAKQIEAKGLCWVRRSAMRKNEDIGNWKIFLGDSVGELRWWWGLADLGFVGGSFGDRGGQNMIEPCAYGVATCFGPNTKNFSDIVKLLLDNSACQQLQTQEELLPWVESMIDNPAGRLQLGLNARETCQKHKGAIDRTWTEILRLLESGLQRN
jgi:3-deoxy-D-manno-octulosonic-acid transferase